MSEKEKIDKLIDKCFRLGQCGWNCAEDRTEYMRQAKHFWQELNPEYEELGKKDV